MQGSKNENVMRKQTGELESGRIASGPAGESTASPPNGARFRHQPPLLAYMTPRKPSNQPTACCMPAERGTRLLNSFPVRPATVPHFQRSGERNASMCCQSAGMPGQGEPGGPWPDGWHAWHAAHMTDRRPAGLQLVRLPAFSAAAGCGCHWPGRACRRHPLWVFPK